MTQPSTPTLVRVMGRWTVTALVINAILGSSIFGLPSVIAKTLGSASPWAWLIGAAGNAVIIACFAEVASRFTQAGGAYLYAHAALGRLPAILVGWLAYLTRVSAVAAGANLFTVNLAEFFPGVAREAVRIGVLTVLLGLFAAVNYRGAKGGARLSNVFTIGKLVPLAIFVAAGIAWVGTHAAAVPAEAASPTGRDWLQALLLIGFAYGGFDGAMFAMGEAKEPRRDAPFALGTAIVFLTVLYTGVQMLVNAALPDPGAADRPLRAGAFRQDSPALSDPLRLDPALRRARVGAGGVRRLQMERDAERGDSALHLWKHVPGVDRAAPYAAWWGVALGARRSGLGGRRDRLLRIARGAHGTGRVRGHWGRRRPGPGPLAHCSAPDFLETGQRRITPTPICTIVSATSSSDDAPFRAALLRRRLGAPAQLGRVRH